MLSSLLTVPDGVGQALYGSMFGYIVQRINEMLSPELTQLKRASEFYPSLPLS